MVMNASEFGVTVLGSAGATSIPVPLCVCELCVEAKADASKARTGPGYYSRPPRLCSAMPPPRREVSFRANTF
jgi:hypothetical protein